MNRNLSQAVSACVLSLLFLSCSTSIAFADKIERVIKDHVSNSLNWSGQGLTTQTYSSSQSNLNVVSPIAIIGDGNRLKSVGGVFAFNPKSGVADPLANTQFHFNFHPTAQDMLNDPYNQTPARPNYSHIFQRPSNADWRDQIGTSGLIPGINETRVLYYWEFDVEALGIITTKGEEHVVSILGEAKNSSGTEIHLTSSLGYLNSVGFQPDWFHSVYFWNLFQMQDPTFPDTPYRLDNPPAIIGVSPYWFNAVRITTVYLQGDYNRDGIVDELDYQVYKAESQNPQNLSADGNGNGRIDLGDYVLWRDHLGSSLETIAPISAAVVEAPSSFSVKSKVAPRTRSTSGRTSASVRQQFSKSGTSRLSFSKETFQKLVQHLVEYQKRIGRFIHPELVGDGE